jgi:serine phosphatase RsbU (regulator of sigma subunit)
MRQLERILSTERPGVSTFATVVSVALSPDGSFNVVSAGHPGMLMHAPDSVDWIEPPGGPALGLNAREWPLSTYDLPMGHGLVLLTDGLFEGRSGRGTERLGEEGLLALARSYAALPGRQFVNELIEDVERRAQSVGGISDDIAVVRVERTAGE